MRISDWSSDVCSSDLLDDLSERKQANRHDHEVDAVPELGKTQRVAHRAGIDVRPHQAEQEADQDHPNRLDERARAQRDCADKANRHQRKILRRTEAERSEEHTSELQSLMRTSYAV